jgi:cytochrome c biogenesis protein CcmG/thiol:disulfide interchange protein DsbE
MSEPSGAPVDEVSGIDERPQNRREWSGALRSLALPLVIVATIVGGLFYLQRRDSGGSANSGGFGVVALPAELNPTGKQPSTDVGRAAPDFLLETPDGGQLRFSDLRGKPVLVNFWASWCTPCRQEMPEIVRAYGAHQKDGLVVVGVDLQENDGQVRDFAQEFGMKFPIAIDRNGGVGQAWHIGGPIQGIPSSYFIDATGVVRARNFGPMSAVTIAQDLATILNPTTP